MRPASPTEAGRPGTPSSPVELGLLPVLHLGQLAGRHPRPAKHLVVDHPHPALADRAHGQLRLEGDAQLSHQNHVQGGAQRPGHFERHRHPTTWQPQDHGILAAQEHEPLGQPATRITAVHEWHRYLLYARDGDPLYRPAARGQSLDHVVEAAIPIRVSLFGSRVPAHTDLGEPP